MYAEYEWLSLYLQMYDAQNRNKTASCIQHALNVWKISLN